MALRRRGLSLSATPRAHKAAPSFGQPRVMSAASGKGRAGRLHRLCAILRAYRYTRCFDASITASADSVAPERLTGLVTMGGGAHLPKVYSIDRDRMIYCESLRVSCAIHNSILSSTTCWVPQYSGSSSSIYSYRIPSTQHDLQASVATVRSAVCTSTAGV